MNPRPEDAIHTHPAALASLILLAACDDGAPDNARSDDTAPSATEATVTWEVTGTVTPDDPLQGYAIDWSWSHAGGNQDITVSNDGDMLPWTKEEALPVGTQATLAVVARPDAIEMQTTYDVDLTLSLSVDGVVVADEVVDTTVPPTQANGAVLGTELVITVE